MKKLALGFLILAIALSIFAIRAKAEIIIKGNDVHIRSSPEIAEDNIIAVLDNGDEVSPIENEGTWVLISWNENGTTRQGYVSVDYLRLEQSTNRVGIAKTRVHLRDGPSTEYKSLGMVEENTIFKVMNSTSKWLNVICKGTYGYVATDYVTQKQLETGRFLGVFTTFFSTHQKGRTKNIQKGAGLLDDCIVAPGETFSLLDAIGPITKAGGYFEAPEYKKTDSGTETVIGYGGGVCQIATTLYQAVLDANRSGSSLEIVERHQHSKSVSYVEDGQDATISWKAEKDFKFKNNNNYKIRLRALVIDGSITCFVIREE